MGKIYRYALYELKIFFRVKIAFFYTLLFPLILLILYFISTYNGKNFDSINHYFPYLISITLISTAGGLASAIVNNRIYNSWKFFNLYGYKTHYMAIALGIVYYIISLCISFILIFFMAFILSTKDINLYIILLMFFAISLGTFFYLEISIITGLLINEPRNAQTIINGLIYFFIIFSGSIIRFSNDNILGIFFGFFPNIHIGNLMHTIWNYSEVNLKSVWILFGYCIVLMIFIIVIIMKENKRLYNHNTEMR